MAGYAPQVLQKLFEVGAPQYLQGVEFFALGIFRPRDLNILK